MNETDGGSSRVSMPAHFDCARWCLGVVALGLGLLSANDAASSQEETSSDESDVAPTELSPPELAPPDRVPADLRVTLGPFVAMRSMTFEGDARTITHRPQPYRGAALSAAFRLAEVDQLDLALLAEGELEYGAARNRELNPRGGPSPRTELAVVGGQLTVHRTISSTLGLGIGLGFQSTSVTIEPNRRYTGHQYLSVDVGAELRGYAFQDHLSYALEAGVLPVVATDNSNDTHGPSSSFGARGALEAAWVPFADARPRIKRGWRLVARYRYQRFRSQFPVSPIGLQGGISVDRQHRVALSIGYVIR